MQKIRAKELKAFGTVDLIVCASSSFKHHSHSENAPDQLLRPKPQIGLTFEKLFTTDTQTCSEYLNFISDSGRVRFEFVVFLPALCYNLQTDHVDQGLHLDPHHELITIFMSSQLSTTRTRTTCIGTHHSLCSNLAACPDLSAVKKYKL